MSKIWRVEEEQIMKAGKIVGTNYTVWYKDENGARTARRDYRHGHYKVIPMTVLNFILDENNEARTRYQEFDGNTYKRTMYQQPTETENAPQAAPQAAEEATTDEEEEETPATPGDMLKVRNIIISKGGYRERHLLTNPHTATRSTWTAEHKVIEILEATPDPDGYRAGCAIDIVTRSIVG